MAGDVLVIRYVGPKGSPGMPEMLSPGSALVGRGLGKVLLRHALFAHYLHMLCFTFDMHAC